MHLFAKSLPPLINIAAMTFIALCAAWYDWKSWRIPNQLLLPGAAAALMLACFAFDGIGLQMSLAGGLCGLGIFLLLYLLNGMGAGDVKLLTTLGLFAGPLLTIDIALLSALIGGVWALVILLGASPFGTGVSIAMQSALGVNWYQRMSLPFSPIRKRTKQGYIPYGVVIAIGMFIAIALAAHA